MVEVMIDGSAAAIGFSEAETVADAIKKIAKELAKGQSVIKVFLDGQDITGRFDMQEDALFNFQKLEVTTGGTEKIALDALESLTDFHVSLLTELNQVSEEYRLGDEEKAHQQFARCLDGLQILMKTTVTAANLLKKPGNEIVCGERNLEGTTLEISSLLDEMIEAQTQSDVILLADLVEYELIPSMEDWGGFMKYLQNAGNVA